MLICRWTHKTHRNYHLITVRLLFIHETIGCVHQTRPRKGKCIQLLASHTLSDHRICHGVRPLGRHVKNRSFSSSSMNCVSLDSITEVFYHLSEMLIAIKYIADNDCLSVRQHTGTSCMQHSPNL